MKVLNGRKWSNGRGLSVGAFATALLATFTLSVSFASSLLLVSPSQPVFSQASRCSSEPAVVTLKAGVAEVSVPEGCSGQQTALYLGAGTKTDSIPVGPGSGVVPVQQGFESPDGVLVTSDTWPLETQWAVEEPAVLAPLTCVTSSGLCEVTKMSIYSWGDSFILTGSLASTSTAKEKWELTINLSSPELLVPMNAPLEDRVTATWLGDFQTGLVVLGTSGCQANPRTVTVQGTTYWGEYNYVGGGLGGRNFQVFGSLSRTDGAKLLDCR